MELRSVEELMDLLYACRGERSAAGAGGGPGDPHGHALRTAALLRRRRPADKELQVAGLVAPVGPLLWPGSPAARTAEAVRPLLGARVARLVRRQAHPEAWDHDDDLASLCQADEEARTAVFDAGVLEDWRTVLELTAARNARLGAVD
ncbi:MULTISPECIES: hypothetical protein [Streptomyces]|uniref:Uncharacterized protein n=1 Tax=Streptomyces tendae TaxID=1932 RepID=A0A6B3QHT9_STRTE|nr:MULTISPECIES: hypothetical protein [Streptomyces]BET45961.1 hypothetical protein RGQ21_09430 [Kitasatospora aureofaciens]MBQ0964004.1 hypothetical protein [Streptomyces sp. RK74B]MBQ1004044.1 hypothetical protein [Streptomyces sp. RK23]MCW1098380.1 hypothetical protein [Streptomyces sp. RS2]MZG19223.1 hypothetical protein [Streptomyces sp. SID5914]